MSYNTDINFVNTETDVATKQNNLHNKFTALNGNKSLRDFCEIEETKIITVEQHTVFTTHRKKPKTTIDICRKGSIVKEKCRQLCEIIANLFPDGVITDVDLTCLIQDYIGADKETIRAYKGYGGHVRAGRCGDNRIVGLSRKGYLEIYYFLVRCPGRRWALVQTHLSTGETTDPPTPHQTRRSLDNGVRTEEKISLSVAGTEHAVEMPNPARGTADSREREKKETTEKERNFSPKILSNAELTLLKANPSEEPDLSKVNWRANHA